MSEHNGGERYGAVVVGAGHAGLAASHFLSKSSIDHVVLERAEVAHSWKTYRWDTFCLVTPNWQCQLPDFPYAGEDPHGFMVRDQIVDYLEAYRAFIEPPVVEDEPVSAHHDEDLIDAMDVDDLIRLARDGA